MPRLERLAQLDLDRAEPDRAIERKTELEMRREPARVELVAGAVHVVDDVDEVVPDVKRQHELIVQLGTPAHEVFGVGLAPKTRDERQQQQLLHEAHARVRRHLEGAELDEAEPARGPIRRIQLVDADLGAMRVAGDVDQQIAEQAVDEPGRRRARRA